MTRFNKYRLAPIWARSGFPVGIGGTQPGVCPTRGAVNAVIPRASSSRHKGKEMVKALPKGPKEVSSVVLFVTHDWPDCIVRIGPVRKGFRSTKVPRASCSVTSASGVS